MGKFDYDVIVIGGSANGSQAANSAAKRGLSVAIIEEHPNTGLPEHCSGLFSYSGLKKLDCMPPTDIIMNDNITGSRIISPNGKIMTVNKGYQHAMVCDRSAFDRFLLNKSTTIGTTLFQPFRAIEAKRIENGVSVKIRKDAELIHITSKILISAEGIRGTITKQMGLKPPNPEKIVNASQFYMYGLNDINTQLVEVYQSHEFAPDFFAWLIPMGKDSAKIGLGTSKPHASKQLEIMIKNHPILKQRCDGAEIRRRTAGRIPITGPVKKTYADNFLMTGDVAGQTKPTTGGGVILGGIAGQIAGEICHSAIEENNLSGKFLSVYQKKWKKEMMFNLRMMRLVRNYMDRLHDNEIDSFFNKLDKKGILKDIEKYGDVDDQGTLIKKFMKTISLYPFYLKTSPRLVKSLLQI